MDSPAFWVAAFLTSAIVRPTVGRSGFAITRGLGIRTWAALVLIPATLAAYRAYPRSVRDYDGQS